MPQPPLDLKKYLATPLPAVRESYPPGTGGTGPRQDWNEGTLKGVHVIEDFADKVKAYTDKLPNEPITPHPAHKYPSFVKVVGDLPSVIKAAPDLMQYLKQIPLLAVATSLTALEAHDKNIDVGWTGPKGLDQAGYESDGGEDPTKQSSVLPPTPDTTTYEWKFSKSPLGSGEFKLHEKGSDKCKLVVRTINSSAFAGDDWDEFVVTGPYSYNTKNKASWYWSRAWGSTKRLETEWFALTDYNRWVFGCFAENHTHGCISPLIKFDSASPTVLQALMYWTRSALGAEGGFKPTAKDVSGLAPLFPANPARRLSTTRKTNTPPTGIRKANESDIEESDAEGQDGA